MNINIFNLFGIIGLVAALGCGLYIEVYCLQTPCFLCFLQRAAMLLIALGLYWNLVYGSKIKHYVFSMMAALLGLSISLRHMGLNVCKPVDNTVFSFWSCRIYTWSFLVFFVSLVALSLLLFFHKKTAPVSSRMRNCTGCLLFAVITICLLSILRQKGVAF